VRGGPPTENKCADPFGRAAGRAECRSTMFFLSKDELGEPAAAYVILSKRGGLAAKTSSARLADCSRLAIARRRCTDDRAAFNGPHEPTSNAETPAIVMNSQGAPDFELREHSSGVDASSNSGPHPHDGGTGMVSARAARLYRRGPLLRTLKTCPRGTRVGRIAIGRSLRIPSSLDAA